MYSHSQICSQAIQVDIKQILKLFSPSRHHGTDKPYQLPRLKSRLSGAGVNKIGKHGDSATHAPGQLAGKAGPAAEEGDACRDGAEDPPLPLGQGQATRYAHALWGQLHPFL